MFVVLEVFVLWSLLRASPFTNPFITPGECLEEKMCVLLKGFCWLEMCLNVRIDCSLNRLLLYMSVSRNTVKMSEI